MKRFFCAPSVFVTLCAFLTLPNSSAQAAPIANAASQSIDVALVVPTSTFTADRAHCTGFYTSSAVLVTLAPLTTSS